MLYPTHKTTINSALATTRNANAKLISMEVLSGNRMFTLGPLGIAQTPGLTAILFDATQVTPTAELYTVRMQLKLLLIQNFPHLRSLLYRV